MRAMEISSVSSLVASASMSAASDQMAIAAIRKVLDSSRSEGEALVRLLEQVPTPTDAHVIDCYA